MFPEMRVTRKIFISEAANLLFLTNLIEFFKQSLPLKNYFNSTVLCLKTKSPNVYCSKTKNVNQPE